MHLIFKKSIAHPIPGTSVCPRYHPDSHRLVNSQQGHPAKNRISPRPVNVGRIRRTYWRKHRVRIAAPEGFSAHPAAPALTTPGSLPALSKLTRFHHRFSNCTGIMPQKPEKINRVFACRPPRAAVKTAGPACDRAAGLPFHHI